MPKSVITADNQPDDTGADHLIMAGAEGVLRAREDEGGEVVFG